MSKKFLAYSAVVLLVIALFSSFNATVLHSQDIDSTAIAEQDNDSSVFYRSRETIPQKEQSSFFGYLLRVIFVTALMIIFIIIGFKYYRKYVLHNDGTTNNRIKILARQAIGQKQYVVIIAMGNKKYALGVTDQSINLITDLGDLDEDEQKMETIQAPAAFSSLLKKISGGKGE